MLLLLLLWRQRGDIFMYLYKNGMNTFHNNGKINNITVMPSNILIFSASICFLYRLNNNNNSRKQQQQQKQQQQHQFDKFDHVLGFVFRACSQVVCVLREVLICWLSEKHFYVKTTKKLHVVTTEIIIYLFSFLRNDNLFTTMEPLIALSKEM